MTLQEYAERLVLALGDGWSLLEKPYRYTSYFSLVAPDGSRIGARNNNDRVRFAGSRLNSDQCEWPHGMPAWSCSPKLADGPEAAAEAILTKLWPRWSEWVAETRAQRAEKEAEGDRKIALAEELMASYLTGRGEPEKGDGDPTLRIIIRSLEPLEVSLVTCGTRKSDLKQALWHLGKLVVEE